MSCQLTVDGPCRRTLSFTIERSRLQSAFDAQVRTVAARSNFKGFRAGKAPLELVKRTHGKSIAEDVRRQVMNEAFQAAVAEHGIAPVGDPELNLERLLDDGTGPFTFELSVEIVPPFELGAVEGLQVEVPLPPVTDEMIASEVLRLRRQAGSLVEAPADAAADAEAVLTATITYVVDGVAQEPRPECAILARHDIVDGMLVPGSGAAFAGRKTGETVELEADLPAHFKPEALAGRRAALTIRIDRLQTLQPAALDADLLGRFGVASEDELRGRIREQLELQRAKARDDYADRAIEDRLLALHTFELPERLTARAIDRRVHEIAHRMVDEQGLGSEEAHHKAEERREQVAAATRRALALSFVFSRIARERTLGATADEAEAEVRQLAVGQQLAPDELLQAARREGWLADVAAQVTEKKTRAWLRERAAITETAPPPVAPASA